jgi:3-hydroxypropanoate dehydrogenase
MLDDSALDLLFRKARTYRDFQPRAVGDAQLRAVYELARLGPTSANCQPARFVFLRSKEAKARLIPLLDKGNVRKVEAAAATVIVAHDLDFPAQLERLYPEDPRAGSWFAGPEREAAVAEVAFRNGSLQGAYLIIAARALGLDAGPMSGFRNAGVDREFFPDGLWRSNFLVNLGIGDPARLKPRNPRLEFEEACRVL